MIKEIGDYNLCDDVLFYEAMKDEELAKMLIEEVLDMKGEIQKIVYIENEKTVKNGILSKGVRFDLYLRDESNIYEVEMQTSNNSLAKRSRKYQSVIDFEWLKKGEKYDSLKPQYIIFICTFDLFKEGLHRYTFKNLCTQNPAIELGDGTTKIFLNTCGTADDVGHGIKEFLYFLEHSTQAVADASDSALVKKAMERINAVKENEVWGGNVMTLEEIIEFRLEKELAEKDMETAKKMKAKNMKIEDIAEITGLSVEEVEKI